VYFALAGSFVNQSRVDSRVVITQGSLNSPGDEFTPGSQLQTRITHRILEQIRNPFIGVSNGTRSCLMKKPEEKITWHCPFNLNFYFNCKQRLHSYTYWIRHYVPFGDYYIFDIISSRRYLPFDIVSHLALLHSTLFPGDVFLTVRHYPVCPIRRLLPSFLYPFDVFFPRRPYVHSTFCPSTIFTASVFYFDILSVNRLSLVCFLIDILLTWQYLYTGPARIRNSSKSTIVISRHLLRGKFVP
jgi:hypothetical protein